MIKKIMEKLSSIKLAVTLIFIISILSIIGIVLPQIPSAFSASPDGYAWWVENVAYATLGTMVYTLEPLGFFNIFHSVWFLGLSALLILNIFICTISRIKVMKSKAEKAKVCTDSEFYQNGKNTFEFEAPMPIKQVGERAFNLLETKNYSVETQNATRNIFIAADKHRLSSWGTLLVHISLILLIIGVLTGVFFGFSDDSFVVAEGITRDIGYDTGLSVYLNSFTDEYWDNGTPKDYRSDIDIFENGKIVKSDIIRVNHPLTYKGVRIHQGSFGQAVNLQISDVGGSSIYNGVVPLTGARENDSLLRNEGEVVLPNDSYHVVILGHSTNGTDPYIGTDEIGIEFYDANMTFLGWLVLKQNTPQQLGDLYFNFNNLQYSGLMISKDPGVYFVWIAAVLFLFGLSMVFYLPHSKIWIKLYSTSKSCTKVSVKFDSLKEFGVVNESELLFKALGMAEKPEGS